MQSTIDNLTKRLQDVEHNKDTEASLTQHTQEMKNLIGKVDTRVATIEKQDVNNMIKQEIDSLKSLLQADSHALEKRCSGLVQALEKSCTGLVDEKFEDL